MYNRSISFCSGEGHSTTAGKAGRYQKSGLFSVWHMISHMAGHAHVGEHILQVSCRIIDDGLETVSTSLFIIMDNNLLIIVFFT
jgi:hypothetical protein